MADNLSLKKTFKEESPDQMENTLTKRVEAQTAKVPSIGYLGLAIGSMVLSIGLEVFAERKEFGNFVGLWAPTFMLLGIYNKIVKLEMQQSKLA